VLFDVEKQGTKPGIIVGYDNYLSSFGGCQLIEMYKGIYDTPDAIKVFEVLIPRVFVYNIDSKANKLPWGKIGEEKIDYTKVEFPEVIGNFYGEVRLLLGELNFILHSYTNALDSGIAYGEEYPEFIADLCLYLQGRKDLIEDFHEAYYEDGINRHDLLYHPELREKLYKEIGEDPNKSYYELAKEKGFDLGRFY
jgi:hypothetical protein